MDAVKAGAFFVIGFDGKPGRFRNIGMDQTSRPLPENIPPSDRATLNPSGSASTDGPDRLCEIESGAPARHHSPKTSTSATQCPNDEYPLKFRAGLQELLILFIGAKTHHMFDSSPVIPTAIETDDFTSSRKMRYIPLKIPLSFFAIAGRTQRNNSTATRVERFGNALNRATLPGCIAPFKQDDNAGTDMLYPILHFYQLYLQTG
jgi:hypothetical protein